VGSSPSGQLSCGQLSVHRTGFKKFRSVAAVNSKKIRNGSGNGVRKRQRLSNGNGETATEEQLRQNGNGMMETRHERLDSMVHGCHWS